jgi:hypothetical protein
VCDTAILGPEKVFLFEYMLCRFSSPSVLLKIRNYDDYDFYCLAWAVGNLCLFFIDETTSWHLIDKSKMKANSLRFVVRTVVISRAVPVNFSTV